MTVNQVNITVHRLRKRLGVIVRAVVAETVDSPVQVNEEIRLLMESIAKGGK